MTTETRTRRNYTEEFKRDAVALVQELSLNIVEQTSRGWRGAIGCPDPEMLEALREGFRKHEALVRQYQAQSKM